MPAFTESSIRAAVSGVKDPEDGNPLGSDQVRDLRIEGQRIKFQLAITTWVLPIAQQLKNSIEQKLRDQFPELQQVDIEFTKLERPARPLGDIGLTVKSVIAVGSGKGGVGKSTIAASIAVGLKRAGAAVGLMDADVYGPSIPHLFGVSRRPDVVDKKLRPIEAAGMPIMSMGFLVPPGEAVVWRGPMLHGAITQFLRDTAWGELDYLIIDMPPGTGDIALTLSQLLPLAGAVVVCTPQDVALLDAVKAIAMFRKVNIHVLGMVENMSGFVCPDCNKRYDIFGSGGAKRRAAELSVPFLGEVPINMQIRVLGDTGQTAASFDDPTCAPYLDRIAQNLVLNLAEIAEKQASFSQLPVL